MRLGQTDSLETLCSLFWVHLPLFHSLPFHISVVWLCVMHIIHRCYYIPFFIIIISYNSNISSCSNYISLHTSYCMHGVVLCAWSRVYLFALYTWSCILFVVTCVSVARRRVKRCAAMLQRSSDRSDSNVSDHLSRGISLCRCSPCTESITLAIKE